jgi:hypothetical protein
MLSGKRLPSLVIVAMGNPQGRCELLPQTKQRFWWVNVGWDAPTWKRYMKKAWGISVSNKVVAAITEQYQHGFAATGEYNYYTPRTVENLFRVAQKISIDHPFWKVSEVPEPMVDAIYESLSNLTTYAKVTEQIQDWFDQVDGTLEQPADHEIMVSFMTEVMSCGGIEDLREFLSGAENLPLYANIMPVFTEWLKENDLSAKPGAHYE